jgi:hypothetical protein
MCFMGWAPALPRAACNKQRESAGQGFGHIGPGTLQQLHPDGAALALSAAAQARISSMVRKHPSQRLRSSVMRHTEMQGEGTTSSEFSSK